MKKRKKILAIVNPELAKQWHPNKNGGLTPFDVVVGSHRKTWWQCNIGHEWLAGIRERNRGDDCPYCSNRKVGKDNWLAVTEPRLAHEWDYNKNKGLTPSDIVAGSRKEIWWICENQHSWKMPVTNRYVQKQNCPYCSGQRVCIDNCLATRNPILAKEWHLTKNDKLTPNDVLPYSHKKVWWKCQKGHEWAATIHDRSGGRGCPYCNGVVLYGKVLCNSIPEAYMYLEYKRQGIAFRHNRQYDKRFGAYRYDFYLIEYDKYIEVTSFTKKTNYSISQYIAYLRGIVNKKRFVENVLGSKFEFIQFTPTKEQVKFVRMHQR